MFNTLIDDNAKVSFKIDVAATCRSGIHDISRGVNDLYYLISLVFLSCVNECVPCFVTFTRFEIFCNLSSLPVSEIKKLYEKRPMYQRLLPLSFAIVHRVEARIKAVLESQRPPLTTIRLGGAEASGKRGAPIASAAGRARGGSARKGGSSKAQAVGEGMLFRECRMFLLTPPPCMTTDGERQSGYDV